MGMRNTVEGNLAWMQLHTENKIAMHVVHSITRRVNSHGGLHLVDTLIGPWVTDPQVQQLMASIKQTGDALVTAGAVLAIPEATRDQLAPGELSDPERASELTAAYQQVDSLLASYSAQIEELVATAHSTLPPEVQHDQIDAHANTVRNSIAYARNVIKYESASGSPRPPLPKAPTHVTG